MHTDKLKKLGYDYSPVSVERSFKGADFHAAVKVGNLVFTSGHVSVHNGSEIRGKVGTDIDLATAQKAAEYAAYNCLCAVGSVTSIENIVKVVKMNGMVNVVDGFDEISEVINGASFFIAKLFGEEQKYHARTAVGMVLPSEWAVEIELVCEISE
ncbi:RidA family protein [Candidatus Dojkabacteria bacterium]|uniref:RidA family protein n=1 Tax=Candidatus Dojkabacteria bacterium TaxID=2099670 RepID=A0A955RK64_9BACT|nr:RidA family protein [Candidatus Dojkabacteria bacterium]